MTSRIKFLCEPTDENHSCNFNQKNWLQPELAAQHWRCVFENNFGSCLFKYAGSISNRAQLLGSGSKNPIYFAHRETHFNGTVEIFQEKATVCSEVLNRLYMLLLKPSVSNISTSFFTELCLEQPNFSEELSTDEKSLANKILQLPLYPMKHCK